MPSAIGIPGLIPVSAGGGGVALYTTIVTNDAELSAALTTNGGDTFIVAGAYSIDTDAIGALDTTPRRFVGAGRQAQGTGPFSGPGVIIEFVGAGGSITSLNFAAGLTESEGVEWENVSMFSSTAALTAFLTGLYSAKNINLNGGSATLIGFADSFNLVNCSFVNGSAGSTGFFGCTGLVNCSVGSKTAGESAVWGFFICESLTNCAVYYTGAIGEFSTAFRFCTRLSNCVADMLDVTSSVLAGATMFDGSDEIHGGVALGPTAGTLFQLLGFNLCDRMSDCRAERTGSNFDTCNQMANCHSLQGEGLGADGTHYTSCVALSGCTMDGTGDDALLDGFTNCIGMTTCRAVAATGIGFIDCSDLSSCRAIGCTGDGFLRAAQISASFSNLNGGVGFNDCSMVSSCDATSNTGDGFSLCAAITACNAVGNAFGYASNVLCGVCTGVANLSGLTDGLNVIFDPVTCPGFP